MDPSLSHLISWAEPTRGDAPLPLTGPSLTLSPLGAPHPPTVFLFGGKFVQNRRLSDEMWAIDLASRVWERVDAGEGPLPRYFHTMDVWEDKLVCFGGMSEIEPHMNVHDDIWFFDCTRRHWLPQPQPEHGLQDPTLLPSARYAHLSAVSRGKLVVSGGQHSDNSWIYEINVYDLKKKVWVSKTDQPERQGLHSKGAYRSVAASAKHRVITPRKDAKATHAHTYSIDEEGEGGEIMCYSNYDFAKVRRELDLFSPLDATSSPPSLSAKHHSPPLFNIKDISSRMHGANQPPGLRFPTGGIVGNHFILCGLYLASTSAAFSVYALNLDTLAWRHLEPAVLGTGSWNRAVIWADQAKLVVFGNQESDLASDYGRRAVSVDHMAIVSLETFGIYTPPRLEVPAKIQEAGLTMLDENLASDFEVVCDDGRRIKCSKHLLMERWAWFNHKEQELRAKASGVVSNIPVDINDTLLGAFNPARLESTHLDLPEPFPVCVAFVQYFYTLSLSTPLQNRAPVLSALLFLAKQYKIGRLAKLVVHALHERLDNTNAVGVYEIATLTGQQNLQVRALNMIHSAKNGSSSRSHKQGPPPAYAGDGTSQDSPQVPPSSQGVSSPSDSNSTANTTPTSTTNGNGTGSGTGINGARMSLQARSESPTLGLDDEEDASAMLSALDINHPPTRHRSQSTSVTGSASASSSGMSHGAHGFPMPPLTRLPLPPPPPSASSRAHSRRGSITSSEATSLFPATPAESLAGSSIRESSIFPRGTSVDSRGSSLSSQGQIPGQGQGQGYGNANGNGNGGGNGNGKSLETLPEDPRLGLGLGLDRSNSTLREKYNIHQPDHPHSHLHQGQGGAPPSAYSSHQAQIIQALSTYQMDGRMPMPMPMPLPMSTPASSRPHRSPSLNSGHGHYQGQYQHQHQHNHQGQDHGFHAYAPPQQQHQHQQLHYAHTQQQDLRHLSHLTSSSSSSASAYSDDKEHAGRIGIGMGMGMGGPHISGISGISTSTADFHIQLDSSSSMGMSTMSTLSRIDTNSSGSTGHSSKKLAKEEKKAIVAAEKAARKQAQQERFEALRLQQAKAMAMAKAETQRKAELEATKAAIKVVQAGPPPAKSKFGKFGAKFTENVLFPSGGGSNSMF